MIGGEGKQDQTDGGSSPGAKRLKGTDGARHEGEMPDSAPADGTRRPRAQKEECENTGMCFNYEEFSRIVSDMELDVFFSQNTMPSLGPPYPSVFAIKNGFIAMCEGFYKKAKEREEKRRQNNPGYVPSVKIQRNYLEVFNKKKRVPDNLQRRIDKNVRKYCRSQAIIHLFRSYFTLVDHHHRVCNTYPALSKSYSKTIFTIFASMKKKNIFEMLSEISTSAKMYAFFKDLYNIWEKECDNLENACVIQNS